MKKRGRRSHLGTFRGQRSGGDDVGLSGSTATFLQPLVVEFEQQRLKERDRECWGLFNLEAKSGMEFRAAGRQQTASMAAAGVLASSNRWRLG